MTQVGYVAYIDEAGDDGIKKIKTDSEAGASEWMVISAALVHAENDRFVLRWLREMIASTKRHQIKYLHFHTLNNEAKLAVCRTLAEKEVTLFSVLSYKRTMEAHTNRAAEKVNINKNSIFYCWMIRLLLEQVTRFVGQKTYIDYGEVTKLRVELSDRGGMDIRQIRNYFDYIRDQSVTGTLYINEHDLDWSVFKTQELHAFANKDRAGLQLADTVASAFYCGLERLSADLPNPVYAELLARRMARDDTQKIMNCGIKLMPRWKLRQMMNDGPQLLRFYANR